MSEKFIGLSLSGVMRRMHSPKLEIERLEKEKAEFEEKLNNPEKRKEHINQVIARKEKRLQDALDEKK